MGINSQLLKMAKLLFCAIAAFALVVQGDVEPGEMASAAEQPTVEQPKVVTAGAPAPSHINSDPFINNWDKSSKQQWDLEDKEEQDMQTDLSKLAADVNGFQSMMKNFKAEQKKIREHYEFKIRDLESENQKLKKELEAARHETDEYKKSRERVQKALELMKN